MSVKRQPIGTPVGGQFAVATHPETTQKLDDQPTTPPPDNSGDWHRHINPDGTAGGWVDAESTIEDGAFISPSAVVSETTVDATSRIDGYSQVTDARLESGTVISGHAVVDGEGDEVYLEGADISGNAVVTGSVAVMSGVIRDDAVLEGPSAWGGRSLFVRGTVTGRAKLVGEVTVEDGGTVCDDAEISGKVSIEQGGHVGNSAKISSELPADDNGRGVWYGTATIAGDVLGDASIMGNCVIGKGGRVCDKASIQGTSDSKPVTVEGRSTVAGSARLIGSPRVSAGAAISDHATLIGSPHIYGADVRVEGHAIVMDAALIERPGTVITGDQIVGGNTEIS